MTLDCFATTFIRESTPGPGAYTTENYRAVGDRYSIHCAVRPKYPIKEPYRSNADYAPLTSTLDNRRSTIGPKTALRDLGPNTPGPSYKPDPRQFLSRSCAIRPRYKDIEGLNVPGPGTYSPQEPGASSNTKTPPMCGRGKIILSDLPDTPGPAAYEPKCDFGKTTPQYSIRPKTIEPGDRCPNPGFAYNNQGATGEGVPRWTMPRAEFHERVNDFPGPGKYEQHPAGGSRRLGAAIRPLYAAERPDKADVPLANLRVFPNVKKATIGAKCGRSMWDTDKSIPGPSFMPERGGEGYKFTIGEKRPDRPPPETPGPTDYNPKNPMQPDNQGFTCKGPETKDAWIPKSQIPVGPGQYNIDGKGFSPQWIIGVKSVTKSAKSRASTRASLVAYNTRRSHSVIQRKGPDVRDE